MKNLDGTGETVIIPDVEGGSTLVVGNRLYFDQYVGSGDIHLKSATSGWDRYQHNYNRNIKSRIWYRLRTRWQ